MKILGGGGNSPPLPPPPPPLRTALTGPRSRHQRRRARDATDFYECMMIHSRIESPSVPVQGIIMHNFMKVLVRYIVTGCIFCAPSGLRQGQVFDPPPPAAPPPRPNESRVPPPPPPGVYATSHYLALMAFHVEKNVVFIHEFSKKISQGGNPPPTPARSLRSLALASR